jgi:hypothetical protein
MILHEEDLQSILQCNLCSHILDGSERLDVTARSQCAVSQLKHTFSMSGSLKSPSSGNSVGKGDISTVMSAANAQALNFMVSIEATTEQANALRPARSIGNTRC